MNYEPLAKTIRLKLNDLFPSSFDAIQFSPVGGGSINETCAIKFGRKQLFCKINSATKFPQLFEKEGKGLELLASQNIIRAPQVIDCFETGKQQVLLLEWITEGERTESFWKNFGKQMAALHQVSNNYYGSEEDNYMGSVRQSNAPKDNWIDFFIHQRLRPLIQQCLSQQLLTSAHTAQFDNLYKQLPSVFEKQSKPSLLHGDLWSGNFMCDENSQPVLIDPAVYFGHASIDLGMTTLFGGFRSGFYDAYNYHSPFPSNYTQQWEVCNLYPLLIHLLLFGRSYLSPIERTLNSYQ